MYSLGNPGYAGRILANCRYLLGTADDAEDLAQEVFVKAYFGLLKFAGRAQFGTWLRRIKVNHCFTRLKSRRARTHVEVDEEAVAHEPALQVPPVAERRLDVEDQRQRIAEVLESMAETLRVPLLLRDADGLSYEEIADRLEIGVSAAKMRVKRRREAFREQYSRAHEASEGVA
ncbi:MAG: RNA polymerase sigma factor [Thermoanaerobaculia bacterium]